MLVKYTYQGNCYRLFVQWTSAEGKSTVFRDLTKKLAHRHRVSVGEYLELAEHLDTQTDKLYEQIYGFIDEYEAVPFDPRFRRIILKSLSEIIVCVNDLQECGHDNSDRLLACLFMVVTDKLRELVKVYLEERAYQSKYRERLRDSEQYIETTPQTQLFFEFEDVLIQMTEVSRQLDCLSETQRRRLVKHIFLNFTLQEIADSEHVAQQSVRESVIAALSKIKQRLL